STADYDLGKKQDAYRRNEVQEYIVWRVADRAVDWFVLREGEYERLEPAADGILRSKVFSGLWLDPAALTSGDSAKVLAVLQRGPGPGRLPGSVARLDAASRREPAAPPQ